MKRIRETVCRSKGYKMSKLWDLKLIAVKNQNTTLAYYNTKTTTKISLQLSSLILFNIFTFLSYCQM